MLLTRCVQGLRAEHKHRLTHVRLASAARRRAVARRRGGAATEGPRSRRRASRRPARRWRSACRAARPSHDELLARRDRPEATTCPGWSSPPPDARARGRLACRRRPHRRPRPTSKDRDRLRRRRRRRELERDRDGVVRRHVDVLLRLVARLVDRQQGAARRLVTHAVAAPGLPTVERWLPGATCPTGVSRRPQHLSEPKTVACPAPACASVAARRGATASRKGRWQGRCGGFG